MMFPAPTAGRHRVAAIAIAALLVGAGHVNADEDWRKLADLLPSYKGKGITGRALAANPATGEAGGFPSLNMTLLSWVPLGELGGPANANDCWGYTSPAGREYAIMGTSAGTHFIEITDPVNPEIVGFVEGPTSLWRDVEVRGHYAYAVSEGGSGVQIIDLAQIDDGVVRHVRNWTEAGYSTTHTVIINPDTPYLYLCGTNIGNGSLLVASIEDPENPVLVGRWDEPGARYAHECQVVSYTEGPLAGREIAYSFYIYGNGGVDILDVTDKSNIHRIGVGGYPLQRGSHQGWLSADRRYLYINDELDEGIGAPPSLTRIMDVSDPTNPVFAGSFSSGRPSVDHNLYVRDNLIYQANYRSGLRIFDASDPLTPAEIAYFDTYPEDDAASYSGAWGNYPFFPSGNIIISDMQRGLFVVRLDYNGITFDFPAGRPERLDPGVPVQIVAELEPAGDSGVDPDSVTLHVRTHPETEFQQIPMVQVGDNLYSGSIPPQVCFATVDYFFSAQNEEGTGYSRPIGAPVTFYSAPVTTGTAVVFEDDMETDRGWTVGDPGDPDTATAGIWNRMPPEATSAQPGEDRTPGEGQICWVTDGRAGNNAGQYDVDGGKTTLMSPVFDLAGLSEARVGYWRWYSNHAGAAPNQDVFTVDISADGGQTWTNAETVGPAGRGTAGGWFYHEFRVADFVTPTESVRLRFVAADEDPGSLVEAAIDDVVVFAPLCEATPCPADWDGDGDLSSADFFAFLNDFFLGNADFDASGGTDSSDFFAFLGAFFEGCD